MIHNPVVFSPSSSAHHGCVLGLDFVDHSGFRGLAIRVFVHAEVFFGHLVNVIVGSLLGNFHDAAADLKIAIGIIRIDDGQSDAGVAPYVAIFLSAARGID